MKICIARGGIEIGEWTEDEVRAAYQEGRLVDSDHYWKPGMSEWDDLSAWVNAKPPPPKLDAPLTSKADWIYGPCLFLVIVWGVLSIASGGSLYYSIPTFIGELIGLAIPCLIIVGFLPKTPLQKSARKMLAGMLILGIALMLIIMSVLLIQGR